MRMNNICTKNYEIRFECNYCIVKDINKCIYLRVKGLAYNYILQHYSEADFSFQLEKLFKGKHINTKKSLLEMQCKTNKSRIVERMPSFLFDYRIVLFVIGIYMVLGSFLLYTSIFESDYKIERTCTYVIILIANIFFHEIGHIIFCLRAGRFVNSYGFKLNYGIPMFYVDTSDICMASKKDRIMTSLGGVYLNSIIGLMIIIQDYLSSGEIRITSLIFIPYFFVISNLIPFMKLDGYYILEDLMDISNLNERASHSLHNTLKRNEARSRINLILLTYHISSILFFLIVIIRILYIFLSWIIA